MKLFYMQFVLLLMPCAVEAQNKNCNFIATKHMVEDKDTLTTIEYFDGLGRSSEIVQKYHFAGGGKDLVSLTEYDGMGNEFRKWNPTPFTTTGDAIAPNIFRSVAKNVYDDTCPYSEYEYDKTMNNRIVKELGPGYAWHVNDRDRKIEYGGIATMKYPLFTLSSDKQSFTFKRYYSMSDLSKVQVTDEDGVTNTKYYNILNQLVMEEIGGNAITYYIYDTSGNLVYVLPPAAYNNSLIRGEIHSIAKDDYLQKYAYFYRFDEKNRCVEKKTARL